MNTSVLYRDITTGLLFTSGVMSFMSGAFIVSTLFFGLSSLLSTLNLGNAG
jgi:hypothetical protein